MFGLIKKLVALSEDLDKAGLFEQSDLAFKIAQEISEDDTMIYDNTFETGVTTPPEEFDKGTLPSDFREEKGHQTLNVGANPVADIMQPYLDKVYAMSFRQAGWSVGREMESTGVDISMKELFDLAESFTKLDSDYKGHEGLASPAQLYDSIQDKLMEDMKKRGQPYNLEVARSIAEWALTPVEIYISEWYSKEDPSITEAMIERAMPVLAAKLANVSEAEIPKDI